MKKAALLLVIALVIIAPAGLAVARPNTSFTDADIKGNYGLLTRGTLISTDDSAALGSRGHNRDSLQRRKRE